MGSAPTILTDIANLTPAWLTAALTASGALQRDAVAEVAITPLTPARSQVFRLTMRYHPAATGDRPQHLVLKLPPCDAPDANQREIDFYQRVAPLAPTLLVLHCFFAASTDEPPWYTLLLEDGTVTHRAQAPTMVPPSATDAEQIVATLARFHARWWGAPELAQLDALPTEADLRAQQATDHARFMAFAEALDDRRAAPRRHLMEQAIAILPQRDGARRCDPAHGHPAAADRRRARVRGVSGANRRADPNVATE